MEQKIRKVGDVTIIENMSNLDYHKDTALGITTLKKIEQNSEDIPHDIKFRELHAEMRSVPNQMPSGLRMGQMIHTAILQPDLLEDDLLTYHKRSKAKKTYGELTGEGKKEVAFIEGLSRQFQTLRDNPDSTRGKYLRALMATELSIFWTKDGIRCKARLDGHTALSMCEIKTIRSGANIKTETKNRNYHIQLAWYMEGARQAGLDLQNVHTLWVETYGLKDVHIDEIREKPIKIKLLEVDREVMDEGYSEAEDMFGKYKKCHEKGDWFDEDMDKVGKLKFKPFDFKYTNKL